MISRDRVDRGPRLRRIARTSRASPVAAAKQKPSVATPSSREVAYARASAPRGRSSASRKRWTSPRRPAATLVGVGAEVRVAADHPAEVAAAVVERPARRLGERARAHQLVVDRQVRALARALLGAGDVLPAAVGQEPWSPLVTSSVPSSSVTRYAGLTVDQWPSTSVVDVAPVAPASHGAVDLRRPAADAASSRSGRLPSGSACRPPRSTCTHGQHPRYGLIVHAERHPRRRRHAVERRLRVDLVEAGVQRLRRVEVAHDRLAGSPAGAPAPPARPSGCPSARTYVRIYGDD